MIQPKRVLVTGAGGFIGRWSVPALLRRGYQVHAVLTRVHGRKIPACLRGAELHAVDLLDPAALEKLVGVVRPRQLLHFAWIATPGVYWTSPENILWLDASRRLLNAFAMHGGSRAVMAGSCAEYDWSADSAAAAAGIFNERDGAPAGASGATVLPYPACKLALRASLETLSATHGLSSAWGRIFFQYGPGEPAQRLVASVITQLLAGRPAPASHGRQIRSFLHVADVAAAFVALLDGDVQGTVNIGSGEPISIRELLELIGRQIGRPGLLQLGAREASAGEPAILLPDVGRLRDEVGWRPAFTLSAGLTDTIAWWQTHLGGGLPAEGPGSAMASR